MRNPAGEGPDRFEFLRLIKLFLKFPGFFFPGDPRGKITDNQNLEILFVYYAFCDRDFRGKACSIRPAGLPDIARLYIPGVIGLRVLVEDLRQGNIPEVFFAETEHQECTPVPRPHDAVAYRQDGVRYGVHDVLQSFGGFSLMLVGKKQLGAFLFEQFFGSLARPTFAIEAFFELFLVARSGHVFLNVNSTSVAPSSDRSILEIVTCSL